MMSNRGKIAECFCCHNRRKVVATISVEVLGADFGTRYLCRACSLKVFSWQDFDTGRELY